jgi:hypothetical protein
MTTWGALALVLSTSTAALANPYRPPLDWKRESGTTGELSFGYGGIVALAGDHADGSSEARAVWFDAAIGSSIGPKTGLVLRASVVTPVEDTGPRVTAGFIGPCVRIAGLGQGGGPLWSSVGVGAAVAVDHMTSELHAGFGWDTRFGIMLPTGSEHSVALTLGLTIGKYGDGWLAGYGIALGYHRL